MPAPFHSRNPLAVEAYDFVGGDARVDKPEARNPLDATLTGRSQTDGADQRPLKVSRFGGWQRVSHSVHARVSRRLHLVGDQSRAARDKSTGGRAGSSNPRRRSVSTRQIERLCNCGGGGRNRAARNHLPAASRASRSPSKSSFYARSSVKPKVSNAFFDCKNYPSTWRSLGRHLTSTILSLAFYWSFYWRWGTASFG